MKTETIETEAAKPKVKKINARILYFFVIVCAIASVSVLAVGIYSGFFDDLNSDVTAQENETTVQENVIAPMDDSVNTEPHSLNDITN